MSDVLRKRTEQAEDYLLCEYAKKSADSEGRAFFEQPDPIRTCFQRDRDRIIHCNAFAGLNTKPRFFSIPSGIITAQDLPTPLRFPKSPVPFPVH